MLRLSGFAMGLLLLAGCSRDTAFEHFTKLDRRHELAVMNLQRVTLSEQNVTQTLFSVIYLNPVEPERHQGGNAFLLAHYDTKHRPLSEFNITLNGQAPQRVVPVDDNSSQRSLMPLNNPWNSYFELTFPKTETEEGNLTLTFGSGPSLKGSVTYRTE